MSRTVSLIIPAYNEAGTVGEIVRTAHISELFSEILVVDDGSTDSTVQVAQEAGAIVISHTTNRGKSQAIKTGKDNTSSEFVCFLDADLINLVDIRCLWELTHPVVSGAVDVTVAVIGTVAQIMCPFLSGQRCMRRSLLDDFDGWDTEFGLEIALWFYLYRKGVKQHKIYWWGVSQRMKEQKRGLVEGLINRLRMYKQIVCTCIRELSRH